MNVQVLIGISIRNVDSPTLHHKNGDMEADSVYVRVYRNDNRSNKELFVNNDNFICLVDYNASGITVLKNGGVPPFLWQQYKHEKIGLIGIAWRNSEYITKVKIGVNSPCPCGSGKKFKKCCRGKMIYD